MKLLVVFQVYYVWQYPGNLKLEATEERILKTEELNEARFNQIKDEIRNKYKGLECNIKVITNQIIPIQ